jgi:hypothetical protein
MHDTSNPPDAHDPLRDVPRLLYEAVADENETMTNRVSAARMLCAYYEHVASSSPPAPSSPPTMPATRSRARESRPAPSSRAESETGEGAEPPPARGPTRALRASDLASLARRGRAMRRFCESVRARGGIATTEENEDLPLLRLAYVVERAALQARRPR